MVRAQASLLPKWLYLCEISFHYLIQAPCLNQQRKRTKTGSSSPHPQDQRIENKDPWAMALAQALPWPGPQSRRSVNNTGSGPTGPGQELHPHAHVGHGAAALGPSSRTLPGALAQSWRASSPAETQTGTPHTILAIPGGGLTHCTLTPAPS